MVGGAPISARFPAVFLDRDGILVVPEFRAGRSFAPRRLEDFRLYPEAPACLGQLKAAGFRLVVVTNQPDVGNGLTPESVAAEMHRRLAEQLPLDAIKACYHGQGEDCACRKPKPALLLEAARQLDVDLSRSFMIGDRPSDVAAGRAAGCRTIFVDLGYTAEEKSAEAEFVVRSLAEATATVLNAASRARAQ